MVFVRNEPKVSDTPTRLLRFRVPSTKDYAKYFIHHRMVIRQVFCALILRQRRRQLQSEFAIAVADFCAIIPWSGICINNALDISRIHAWEIWFS